MRGRNRPSWNGYQRDENTEKAADWIKPHHGPCFSPDRAQPPTSLPTQSDNPTGGEHEDSIPCTFLHWRKRYLIRGEFSPTATAGRRSSVQRGSLVKAERKNGPDVWQFRWSEKGGDGRRVYRKRVIGTIEHYDAAEARQFAARIIAKPSSINSRPTPAAITVKISASIFNIAS